MDEPSRTPGPPGALDMKVMTFNLRACHYDDGLNAWPNRAPLAIDTIQKYASDVLGLQELHADHAEGVRRALEAYDIVLGPASHSLEAPEFNPIFWRAEQWRLVQSGGFYLSPTPEVQSAAWASEAVRSVTWVKLQSRQSSPEILFMNTHFDWTSAAARLESARLVLSMLPALREGDSPVVLTGDFNTNPWWPTHLTGKICDDRPYRLLRAAGFVDSFLAAGNADGERDYTIHEFLGAAYDPAETNGAALRVDWILACDGAWRVRTDSCRIIRDSAPPLFPSDHYAVLAHLTCMPVEDR